MKTFFKKIGFYLSVPFVTIALGFSVLSLLRKAKKYTKDPKSISLEDRQRRVYKLFKKILYIKRIEVIPEGIETLPVKQMIFMPNHKSNWDPIVLYNALYEAQRLVGPTSFISKIEHQDKKAINAVITLLDGIYIKRDDGRSILDCFNKQMENIKKGFSIIVFPEGTRVPGDEFKQFQPACLKVAYLNFLTVAPVAIYGADIKNHKPNGLKYRVYVSALKPIQANDYINTKQEFFMANIQEQVVSKYNELKQKSSTKTEK